MLDPSLYVPNIPGLDEALPVDVYAELVDVDVDDVIQQISRHRIMGVQHQGQWFVEAPGFCEDKLRRIHARRCGSHSQNGSEERKQQVPPRTPKPNEIEMRFARALGLSGQVTRDEVKRRWRELSAQYHPDKVQHLGPKLRDLAESEMKAINEAYDYFKGKYQL